MSINEKLATIQQQVENAHAAITSKGGVGTAGTANLVTAINTIPTGGGGDVSLTTPTVYLKIDKLMTRTPANDKQYLNGEWTRDLEWLSPENVELTFTNGSFSWGSTRALARYKKTTEAKTYYLYVHTLDGSCYSSTDQWDTANVTTLAQFLSTLDSLGWSGFISLYYTISATDYTPEQITSYNFESSPELPSFSAQASSSSNINSSLIWNLFGFNEWGGGSGSGDYSYNITNKSADNITFTIVDNPYGHISDWNNTNVSYIGFNKNFLYGRLILDDGVDYLSGQWNAYTDKTRPSSYARIGKQREWKHSVNELYAAELTGEYTGDYGYSTYPEHGGFGFMQIPFPQFPNASQSEWKTRYYTLGNILFPTYRMRKVEVATGGSGYSMGDLITVSYTLCKSYAIDASPLTFNRVQGHRRLLLCVTGVDSEGAVTSVTDLTYDAFDTDKVSTTHTAGYHAFNYWLMADGNSGTITEPVASATLIQDYTNGNGSGFTGTIYSKQYGELPDYEPFFGAERDFYWVACKVSNASDRSKFPYAYELYRIRTSLSPIVD